MLDRAAVTHSKTTRDMHARVGAGGRPTGGRTGGMAGATRGTGWQGADGVGGYQTVQPEGGEKAGQRSGAGGEGWAPVQATTPGQTTLVPAYPPHERHLCAARQTSQSVDARSGAGQGEWEKKGGWEVAGKGRGGRAAAWLCTPCKACSAGGGSKGQSKGKRQRGHPGAREKARHIQGIRSVRWGLHAADRRGGPTK